MFLYCLTGVIQATGRGCWEANFSFKGRVFPELFKTKHRDSTRCSVCVFRVLEGCRLRSWILCASKSVCGQMSQSFQCSLLKDPPVLNRVGWASNVRWQTRGRVLDKTRQTLPDLVCDRDSKCPKGFVQSNHRHNPQPG